MPVIKQKTVSVGQQRQRVGIKKLKNDMRRGGEFMYEVVDLDTGDRFGDPFTNKREAMKSFRQTVKDIERGMESAAADTGGGDFLSGPGDTDPFGDFL